MIGRVLSAVVGFAAFAHVVTSRAVPQARETDFSWDAIKYLVAFGDSYTFVQGTGTSHPTFIGSGLADEFAFTPHQLLEDRIGHKYDSTAEGGPNWVEFLTGCGLGDNTTTTLPSDCAVQLWDFAYAGADVSDAYIARHSDEENPLVKQTQQYLEYAEPVLGPDMDKGAALVAVWIGVNDVVDTLSDLGDSIDYQAFWGDIIGAVFAQAVEPLRAAGHRHFLLLNLPPLDRSSTNQKQLLPRPSARLVGVWNGALARRAAEYARDHPGVTALLYDANAFLNGVMDNPADYNITNTDGYCDSYAEPDVLDDPGKYGCEPLNQYFWHNGWHLSSHTHKIMVDDLRQFLESQ